MFAYFVIEFNFWFYLNKSLLLMFVLFTISRYKMILGVILLGIPRRDHFIHIGVQNDPLVCLHKNANKKYN